MSRVGEPQGSSFVLNRTVELKHFSLCHMIDSGKTNCILVYHLGSHIFVMKSAEFLITIRFYILKKMMIVKKFAFMSLFTQKSCKSVMETKQDICRVCNFR